MKKSIFGSIIMKMNRLATLFVLPMAVWANESLPSSLETSLETEVPQENVQSIDSIAPVDSSDAKVTESEFSGNEAIDSADEGNIDAPAAQIAEAQVLETEPDGDILEKEGDDAEITQEEEAEVADAMDRDSTLQGEKLVLDMTQAVIPSASRRIASPYGIRTYRMHRGVDLGLCHGEDRTIVAAFPGKVKLVRNQGRRKGYGKYVILDHGNGLTTLYAHLASWKVKVGDEVQAGDTIGIGGNTGRSFGAHLHFEIKYNGVHIDPTTVFNFQEGTYLTAQLEIDPRTIEEVEVAFQKELSKHRYYKVRRGDCLGKIARRYGISVGKLKRLNGLRSDFIRPGQVLKCS